MPSYETIRVDAAEGVVEVALNRPEVLNALDQKLAEELCGVLDWAAGREDVRALLLRGEGRAFCAGGDVKAMRTALDAGSGTDFFERPLAKIHEAALALARLPKPTIGAIHGFAAGAGWNLALCCDLLLCEPGTRFHQAFVRIGAVPDTGGTYTLPLLVGRARAMELLYLGDMVDAEQALGMGLVNRVVPAERLLDEARALARKLATGPTQAYAEIKQLVGASSSLADALDREQQAQLRNGTTADFREGVASFFEKRAPRYRGR